jgi:signal peptidase I
LRGPIERLFPNLSHGPRVVIDWVMTIVGAVLIVFAVKTWVVNPYRIPSPSMEPTLHCALPEPDCEANISDRVLANRFIYRFRDPRRGEIVVFNTPKLALQKCGTQGTFVKRLIEPYIDATRRDSQTLTLRDIPPRNTYTRIPKGYYLMMGDNRSTSCDSRRWGLVPRKNLIGKVFATYWPPKRISFH